MPRLTFLIIFLKAANYIACFVNNGWARDPAVGEAYADNKFENCSEACRLKGARVFEL